MIKKEAVRQIMEGMPNLGMPISTYQEFKELFYERLEKAVSNEKKEVVGND